MADAEVLDAEMKLKEQVWCQHGFGVDFSHRLKNAGTATIHGIKRILLAILTVPIQKYLLVRRKNDY